MGRRIGWMALVLIFAACLQSNFVSAEQQTEEARTKLNKLRAEIRQVKYDHEQDVQKVNEECDKKVNAAREEFHKARTKYLEEKKGKLEIMNRAYKGKVGPMEAEEKDLLQTMVPAQGNFAKPKKR